MVLRECGRVPFSYIYFTKRIKYWCKLLHMFIGSLKQRLTDCMAQNWSDDVSVFSRCDTYFTSI